MGDELLNPRDQSSDTAGTKSMFPGQPPPERRAGSRIRFWHIVVALLILPLITMVAVNVFDVEKPLAGSIFDFSAWVLLGTLFLVIPIWFFVANAEQTSRRKPQLEALGLGNAQMVFHDSDSGKDLYEDENKKGAYAIIEGGDKVRGINPKAEDCHLMIRGLVETKSDTQVINDGTAGAIVGGLMGGVAGAVAGKALTRRETSRETGLTINIRSATLKLGDDTFTTKASASFAGSYIAELWAARRIYCNLRNVKLPEELMEVYDTKHEYSSRFPGLTIAVERRE